MMCVRKVDEEAIETFAADRTGRTDWAMRSGGGAVVYGAPYLTSSTYVGTKTSVRPCSFQSFSPCFLFYSAVPSSPRG